MISMSIGGMISLLGFFMMVISITRVFKLSGEMPDDKDALKIKFDLSSGLFLTLGGFMVPI